jgi:hypothetical protein
MREEPVATAWVVLAVSLVFAAAGVALLFVGGIAVLFAIVLLAFGVMGMAQAIAIAFGRQRPSDGKSE